ncbi:MAG: hypothetical protein F6K65_00705 [Moorea sp. SIO3C2]|nr:hypothetical protein [Moorena sp. SIO3C2]
MRLTLAFRPRFAIGHAWPKATLRERFRPCAIDLCSRFRLCLRCANAPEAEAFGPRFANASALVRLTIGHTSRLTKGHALRTLIQQ